MSTATDRRRISQLRIVAQRLVGEPWGSPAEATRAMMCMQGQDWPGVLVSMALRSRSWSIVEVRESFNSREVVRSWPQRGTLHVLPAEDVGWYLKLTALPRLLGQEKRRIDHGIESQHLDGTRELTYELLRTGEIGEMATSPDRASGFEQETLGVAVTHVVDVAVDGASGSSTPSSGALPSQAASREALIGAWTERGALVRKEWAYYMLHHLCIEGVLVQGPVGSDGHQKFVLAEDWIENPRSLDREEAVFEVVSRYLTSHGPASRKDVNWWSQLPLREIDTVIDALKPELTGIVVDGETYWVHGTDKHSIKSRELVAPTTCQLHCIIERLSGAIDGDATVKKPKLPKRNARPLTDAENNDVIKRYQAGEGIMKLSKDYAVDPSTLSRTLRSRGVPPQHVQRRQKTINNGV